MEHTTHMFHDQCALFCVAAKAVPAGKAFHMKTSSVSALSTVEEVVAYRMFLGVGWGTTS